MPWPHLSQEGGNPRFVGVAGGDQLRRLRGVETAVGEAPCGGVEDTSYRASTSTGGTHWALAPETTCIPFEGASAAQSSHQNPESHGTALSLPDK